MRSNTGADRSVESYLNIRVYALVYYFKYRLFGIKLYFNDFILKQLYEVFNAFRGGGGSRPNFNFTMYI